MRERNLKLRALQTQISRSDYRVDEQAVAEAILRRMIEAKLRIAAGELVRHAGPGPRSGEVLEAG